MSITKNGMARGLLLALVVGLMGCEQADARLKNLHAGMALDSVVPAMDGAKAARTDPFLYKGQYIQTMYFPRKGKSDSLSLTDRKMSPVVLIGGKVTGWGWDYWDSVAAANKIPVAPKK